MDILEESKI
jgi:transposase